jgi:hypothetical protein
MKNRAVSANAGPEGRRSGKDDLSEVNVFNANENGWGCLRARTSRHLWAQEWLSRMAQER